MLATLIRTKSAERAQMKGLDDGRKDQIIAGALLVEEDVQTARHQPDQAVRPGACVKEFCWIISRVTFPIWPSAATSLIRAGAACWIWPGDRTGIKTHSEHVAALCLKFFDELRSLHGLGNGDRELIEYGAMLHDIGWHIGRENAHHKHSMYLIANGDLKGFTPEEIKHHREHRALSPQIDPDFFT